MAVSKSVLLAAIKQAHQAKTLRRITLPSVNVAEPSTLRISASGSARHHAPPSPATNTPIAKSPPQPRKAPHPLRPGCRVDSVNKARKFMAKDSVNKVC
jgi:hypothetical protein